MNGKVTLGRYLRDSRDVASQHVAILRRFDQVFLAMVEQIQTNQDRLDVIAELQQFVNEDHRDSIIMSENFLNLRRDIDHFVQRFDQWIIDQGVGLENQAKELKRQIEGIQKEIEGLDKQYQINDASIALAVSAGLRNVIGMIVAGSLLFKYQAQRAEKERRELSEAPKSSQKFGYLRIILAIFVRNLRANFCQVTK